MSNFELGDKIPGAFQNVISSMPCVYNSTIEDLGWGMIVPKCVHREKCLKQYSIFDQIRLNIFSDGGVGGGLNMIGDGGSTERQSSVSNRIVFSEQELDSHRASQGRPCTPKTSSSADTRVCSSIPKLAIPSIPAIHVTRGHVAPTYDIEVSGIEPIKLTVASASAAVPHSDTANVDDNVVVQIEESPCGNFMRSFQIIQLLQGEVFQPIIDTCPVPQIEGCSNYFSMHHFTSKH